MLWMPPCRTFGSTRDAGSPAQCCLSVVLKAAGAGAEPPHRPERKMGRSVAVDATELPPLQTQAKTRHASRTWRDTRSRFSTARSSLGRAQEPLSGMTVNSPLYAQWALGTRKLHAAGQSFTSSLYHGVR